MLNDKQMREYKQILKERFRELREEIRAELLDSDEERFIDIAGQVHDLEEESLADLLVDLDLAVLDMHIDEIRDIDAALIRIAGGNYGVCIDCGDGIPPERLRAYPTATRCRPCQAGHERRVAGESHSSF